MKKIILIIIIVLIRNIGYTQTDVTVDGMSNSKVSISIEGNKFQLKNDSGKIIVADLDTVYQDSHFDFFIVQKKGLWGIMSNFGNVFIPIEFDTIKRSFNEFWIVSKNRKKGIYSVPKGKIIPVEFDEIKFSGLFNREFIVRKDNKTGVFNSQGSEVIPINYEEIKKKQAVLELRKNNKSYYFIGNKIISDSLHLDKSFQTQGQYLSENENFYVFQKNGTYGVVNHKNEVVISTKYQDILYQYMNENYLLVKQNNLWGMIDIEENQIIPIQFQSIELIDSAFAIVGLNNFKNFYNFKTKKLIDEFNFDSFYWFNKEFIVINKGEKATLVDNKKQFKLVFPFIYESVSVYDKYFIVKQNAKYGLIDRKQKIVIPIQYDNLSLSCNKIIAQKDGKYGILSLENKVLIPFENHYIIAYDERIEIYQNSTFNYKTYDCNLNCIENCNSPKFTN